MKNGNLFSDGKLIESKFMEYFVYFTSGRRAIKIFRIIMDFWRVLLRDFLLHSKQVKLKRVINLSIG